jgi:hypothetical protein
VSENFNKILNKIQVFREHQNYCVSGLCPSSGIIDIRKQQEQQNQQQQQQQQKKQE